MFTSWVKAPKLYYSFFCIIFSSLNSWNPNIFTAHVYTFLISSSLSRSLALSSSKSCTESWTVSLHSCQQLCESNEDGSLGILLDEKCQVYFLYSLLFSVHWFCLKVEMMVSLSVVHIINILHYLLYMTIYYNNAFSPWNVFNVTGYYYQSCRYWIFGQSSDCV